MHPDKSGAPFTLSPDKMQKRRIAPVYEIQKGKVVAHSRNRQSSGIFLHVKHSRGSCILLHPKQNKRKEIVERY